MEILVQAPIFCSSSDYGYYTPYKTPPYLALREPHFLRFSNPPTLPPTDSTYRTQSVIMKCSKSSTESGSEHSSSSEADFTCNWQECGSCFESLESLAQHVTLRHAVASLLDGLYYCRWHGCQRSERGFNARYKMLVHVRTHTKEKPHCCHLCDKSFSRAENLKIHIRSHSGEKPYKCHYVGCQKAYSNSSDRFKHTRTHSMEKPYSCKVAGCQKRYTDPSSLRKHVKTFKHSIQLIDSQSSAESKDSSYNCHVPAAPASPSNCYYLELTDSEHVVTAGDYHSSEYWLKSARYLHSEEFALEVEMDTPTPTPLDLRVHKS
ncbi:zinc finger protein GLIS2 homolog isoform X2 [Drosophila busckii]|uniref:zinc finger protein GLIS2 homolog isoform X2 n=1 Tax=Drosophila busckii TaxID=30019 RepID=UPI00083EAE18|nr:zinc finger protein GLIS2 homolog isoform X2 [Drosophila busckii]